VGFLGVAVLYLALRAEFVAAVQVLVYAGGIMVLYLFGVMFVDSEVLRATRQSHSQAWPAFFLTMAMFVALGYMLYHSEYKASPAGGSMFVVSTPAQEAAAKAAIQAMAKDRAGARRESNPVRVSRALFGDFLYPFEAASVLLTVAVLGGVFLAKKEI
jgi:NADH-quinone oxidoreductase subunit J